MAMRGSPDSNNMVGSIRGMEESRLLALPAELRQEVWQYVLASASGSNIKDGVNESICTITRTCTLNNYISDPPWNRDPRPLVLLSHDFEDESCPCNFTSKFRVLRSDQCSNPSILRTCKSVYAETMPILYGSRVFAFNIDKRFRHLHDWISDLWFLADRFLRSIPEVNRRHIRYIKLPWLLSRWEVYGCHDSFYSIARRLPALSRLQLDLCINSVIERFDAGADDNSPPGINAHVSVPAADNPPDHFKYWLGPIMAFGDTTVRAVCVDKLELEPELFRLIRTRIEYTVWSQIMSMKQKRDKRRLARIERRLAVFGYRDCEGIVDS